MSVMHNAANAAFQDPRFPPVTESEVDDLEVEISVLTPSRTIDSVDEIELGRHGIILERGMHRSVFLPQVAVEQGWNLETTLRHLALKAGLEANDWRKASFSIFETILFSEQEPG
jgi:AmmeMemoRadiSam system protein A